MGNAKSHQKPTNKTVYRTTNSNYDQLFNQYHYTKHFDTMEEMINQHFNHILSEAKTYEIPSSALEMHKHALKKAFEQHADTLNDVSQSKTRFQRFIFQG